MKVFNPFHLLFILMLCLGLGVSTSARADAIDDFLRQQGADSMLAADVQSQAAMQAVQDFTALSRSLSPVMMASDQLKKQLKLFSWDLLGEGLTVLHALFTEGPEAALIQLAGSLADLVVEYGVPYLAGVLCATFSLGIGAPVCYLLAQRVIKLLDLDDLAEEEVKSRLRREFADRRRRDPLSLGRPQAIDAVVANGDININVVTGRVNTQASNGSTAISEIGVARGGNVDINVTVGDVNTTAKNHSYAYTGVGVANADSAKIDVHVGGDINTHAKNHSTAVTRVGVAEGANSRVEVGVRDDINTLASDRSVAESNIGVSVDTRSNTSVAVDQGVNTVANNNASAHSNLGIADGGRTQVYVKGVNTIARNGNVASSDIGISNGGSSTVSIGGEVNTIAGRGRDASTTIGVNSSVSVRGSVINQGGDLEIGGACAARRDGQCCIEIHRNYCVLVKVPTHKGHCPPRFERWGGLCYLYSDKRHSIRK